MKTFTLVKIDNMMDRRRAEKRVAQLEHVTRNNYHNFKYLVCPVGGSFDIILQSDYEFDGETEKERQIEMLEFFNFMLIDAYCEADRDREGYKELLNQ